MRILFDHGTPAPLRRHLAGHSVTLAKEIGWSRLVNGELLRRAEQAGFDLLLTTDKNLGYQQNLAGRKIAILVLGRSAWTFLRHHTDTVAEAVDAMAEGDYRTIQVGPRS